MQRGQVYKTPAGTWALRFYDGRGKRKHEGGFKSKGEASRILAERLTQIRLGTLYRPEITVAELCDKYLDQHQADLNTILKLRRQFRRAIAEFGDTRIALLDPADLGAWRAKLPEGYRHDLFRAVRQVLEQAVRWRWLDENPAKAVKNPRVGRAEITPFTDWAEVEAVAAELVESYRAIPIFAAGTGLRPEEWIALRPVDVDLKARVVTVNQTFSQGRLRKLTKTERSRRRVPLRQRVVQALGGCELLADDAGTSPLLFPSRGGGYIDLNNFRERHWAPAFDSGGLEKRRIYDLRHTYATWSLAANISLFTLARRMGTSVAQIDATYGHLAPDAEAFERDLLDAWDAERAQV